MFLTPSNPTPIETHPALRSMDTTPQQQPVKLRLQKKPSRRSNAGGESTAITAQVTNRWRITDGAVPVPTWSMPHGKSPSEKEARNDEGTEAARHTGPQDAAMSRPRIRKPSERASVKALSATMDTMFGDVR